MQCKDCGDDHVRIRSKTSRKKNGRWAYVDQEGKQWNGLTCPPCKYRSKKTTPRVRARLCNHCKRPMGVESYFNHPGCLAVCATHYDAYDYGYSYGR